MAKFNKDRFFNNVTERVQAAINTHVITDEDYQNNDKQRLHGVIQFLILEQLQDRKFAIDVLDDFNYDDKFSWEELEGLFGKFKSIKDLALVNLWKFMEAQGATEFEYYHKADTEEGTPILDIARKEGSFDNENEPGPVGHDGELHTNHIGDDEPLPDENSDDEGLGSRRLQRNEDE